ncbi:MAG TPA: CaiB/BaiF CoA-transferase family protein [Thermoleophilaceae bacterium]|nr:CaiB/BaiF CoA-transferase family protein [Thermoleophilaceae bacterium]
MPPLDGLRVLDLSRVLAGPYATLVLADLGADVVKVERPGLGDETRGWGPPYAGGESAYYLSVNRGKRSCAIDLSTDEGRGLAFELCARADVVIENFKTGTAERMGLDRASVAERNPKVVYCSITGFGSKRNPAGRPGYDFVAQAESGIMSITGEADGEPMKVGVAMVDVLTGLHAASAILAAVYRGEGDRIEVSLLDSGLAGLINVGSNVLVAGGEPSRHGNAHPNIVPYQSIPTADGWIAIAAPNDGLYQRLCDVLGAPELAGDERFVTNNVRVENRETLVPLMEERLQTKSAEEWLTALEQAGVPAGKIRTVPDALRAAAEAGVPASTRVPHPTAGEIQLMNSPIQIESGLRPPHAPPLLGEHTAEVLGEIGIADAEIQRLAASGVVALGG